MSEKLEPTVSETYDRYAPQIYRYIYHRLGNQSLAEDLTSEVFVRFLRARVTPASPVAYLYRCAHNVVVDYLRKNPAFCEPLDDCVIAQQGDPAKIAEIEVERFRLRRAILRLTPDQQQVIVRKYVEGLSNAEIGRVLGRPESAVKALQHRALANLRNLLGADMQSKVRLEFAGLLES